MKVVKIEGLQAIMGKVADKFDCYPYDCGCYPGRKIGDIIFEKRVINFPDNYDDTHIIVISKREDGTASKFETTLQTWPVYTYSPILEDRFIMPDKTLSK